MVNLIIAHHALFFKQFFRIWRKNLLFQLYAVQTKSENGLFAVFSRYWQSNIKRAALHELPWYIVYSFISRINATPSLKPTL